MWWEHLLISNIKFDLYLKTCYCLIPNWWHMVFEDVIKFMEYSENFLSIHVVQIIVRHLRLTHSSKALLGSIRDALMVWSFREVMITHTHEQKAAQVKKTGLYPRIISDKNLSFHGCDGKEFWVVVMSKSYMICILIGKLCDWWTLCFKHFSISTKTDQENINTSGDERF